MAVAAAVPSGMPIAIKPAVKAASATPTPPGTGMKPAKRLTNVLTSSNAAREGRLPERPQTETQDDREHHLRDQIAAEKQRDLLGMAQHAERFLCIRPLLPQGLAELVQFRAGLREEVRDSERCQHEEDRCQQARPVESRAVP